MPPKPNSWKSGLPKAFQFSTVFLFPLVLSACSVWLVCFCVYLYLLSHFLCVFCGRVRIFCLGCPAFCLSLLYFLCVFLHFLLFSTPFLQRKFCLRLTKDQCWTIFSLQNARPSKNQQNWTKVRWLLPQRSWGDHFIDITSDIFFLFLGLVWQIAWDQLLISIGAAAPRPTPAP